MISKELLSELFNKKVKEFVVEKNELRYILEDDNNDIPELYYINIYELVHKCKEWALSKGFDICSGYDYDIADGMYFCTINRYDIPTTRFAEYSYSEVEAVIKACEWILKETNGKYD